MSDEPNGILSSSGGRTAAAVGIGVATAAVAAGALLLSRSSRHPHIDTDAPNWTLDKSSDGSRPIIGKTQLVGAPRDQLFKAWSRFEDFPKFMENVERVETLGDDRSRWTIKAPAGKQVTLVNRVTERVENQAISWQSEPDSDIANAGKVTFADAPEDRGTYVTLVLSYDPPAGTMGRLFAKLFQREPAIQARRDLRRFKQLIETGEVTTNASPSGRSSESPAEAHI
ncbi:SRPBCC family protein [Sphingomonas sabuli]|uniref:SRPBCC family protein n=1 Tax=Sphingomonas sabuli TaxID=2764186 RepID=UPI001FE4E577|nr:SRPBCC family protein [Sphingomonas sabuli]